MKKGLVSSNRLYYVFQRNSGIIFIFLKVTELRIVSVDKTNLWEWDFLHSSFEGKSFKLNWSGSHWRQFLSQIITGTVSNCLYESSILVSCFYFFLSEATNTRHFNDFSPHITQKPLQNIIKHLLLSGLHKCSTNTSSMAVKWIITWPWPCKYLKTSCVDTAYLQRCFPRTLFVKLLHCFTDSVIQQTNAIYCQL